MQPYKQLKSSANALSSVSDDHCASQPNMGGASLPVSKPIDAFNDDLSHLLDEKNEPYFLPMDIDEGD